MSLAFKTAPQRTTRAGTPAVWKEADDINVSEFGWAFGHLGALVTAQRSDRFEKACRSIAGPVPTASVHCLAGRSGPRGGP